MPDIEELNLLHPMFWWGPRPVGDPGPEVYALLQSLPTERKAEVVKVINEARSRVESAKSQGYAQIAEAMRGVAAGTRG